MTGPTLLGLAASVLVGFGLYGLIADPRPLRKLLAFNVLGSGVFIVFGVIAQRGGAAGLAADPVPQALLITGLVVAFAATALGVALMVQLERKAPGTGLDPEPTPTTDGTAGGNRS